jgi:hypothetical protein
MEIIDNKKYFKDPSENFIQIPNAFFDELMPILPPAAFQIICLIYRKTRGWHKDIDRISISQIVKGTSIKSDRTVRNALKYLKEEGFISVCEDGSQTLSYSLNMSGKNYPGKNYRSTPVKITAVEAKTPVKITTTKDTSKTKKIQSPNVGNGSEKTNKQPELTPQQKSELILVGEHPNVKMPLTEQQKDELLFFGKHPDGEAPNPQFDTIQEIQNSGWQIRNHIVEQAIVYYLEAVRQHHTAFAVPNNKSVRSDWYKTVNGHLQDYRVDDLKIIYPAAIERLKERGMTFSRPGSLTKSLPDVAMETQTGDVVAWL